MPLTGCATPSVLDLERLEFDVCECESVFDDIVWRYRTGMFPFRHTAHLKMVI